jgi:hypothetical protein
MQACLISDHNLLTLPPRHVGHVTSHPPDACGEGGATLHRYRLDRLFPPLFKRAKRLQTNFKKEIINLQKYAERKNAPKTLVFTIRVALHRTNFTSGLAEDKHDFT